MKTAILAVFRVSLPLLAIGVSSGRAVAASQCPGTPHTVHAISVNEQATCVLSKLYEPQEFCLVDASGNDIDGTPFNVVSGTGASFSMILGDDADFNMEYALTCVVNDGASVNSPKVIFNIGAAGAADPNISVVNYNGAAGTWQSTGSGENYSIVF